MGYGKHNLEFDATSTDLANIEKAMQESRVIYATYGPGGVRRLQPLQDGTSRAHNPVLRAIENGVPKLFYTLALDNVEVGECFDPSVPVGSDAHMIDIMQYLNVGGCPDEEVEQPGEQAAEGPAEARAASPADIIAQLRMYDRPKRRR